MRLAGVLLVVLGILAFVYGGFSYTKKETVIDVGPVEGRVQEREHVTVPPLAGALAILAGAVLLLRRPQRSGHPA